MFVLTTVVDTIKIPPHLLAAPTLKAVHNEMDHKYPNRVLMDVGLVICRYGDCLKIGDGICVTGDGSAHHECLVKLVVFRPFVEEVCVGRIIKSTAEGIHVSLGFFQDIFIPPYWMLSPSHYDAKSGLWLWTPNYDEDDEEEENEEEETPVKEENEAEPNEDDNAEEEEEQNDDTNQDEENRYEMEIGAEIRFKVKSINFTQITNTAKGVQATTTTTAQTQKSLKPDLMGVKGEAEGAGRRVGADVSSGLDSADKPNTIRKRSLSVDLTESQDVPATMYVIASICEDGLGLTSWWETPEEDGEEEAEEEEEAEAEDETGYEQVEEDDHDGI